MNILLHKLNVMLHFESFEINMLETASDIGQHQRRE